MYLYRLLTATLVLSSTVPIVASAAEAAASVRVEVTGLRNTAGHVVCKLFNAPEGFPEDNSRAYRKVIAPIKGAQASCDFKYFLTCKIPLKLWLRLRLSRRGGEGLHR